MTTHVEAVLQSHIRLTLASGGPPTAESLRSVELKD